MFIFKLTIFIFFVAICVLGGFYFSRLDIAITFHSEYYDIEVNFVLFVIALIFLVLFSALVSYLFTKIVSFWKIRSYKNNYKKLSDNVSSYHIIFSKILTGYFTGNKEIIDEAIVSIEQNPPESELVDNILKITSGKSSRIENFQYIENIKNLNNKNTRNIVELLELKLKDD